MINDEILNDYFEWLYNIVCKDNGDEIISYRKLLMYLHSVRFRFFVKYDVNRAKDGEELRCRYSLEKGYVDPNGYAEIPECLDGPCSVLEMMIALAMRCEETIMDNPSIGNRTSQWFFGMIISLGLGSMTDSYFDKKEANDIITRFLNRDYEPNGKGGLFTIKNCKYDLRNIEIWKQLCWYLNNFI